MAELPSNASLRTGDFPDLLKVLLDLGLAELTPHLQHLGINYRILSIQQGSISSGPLPTPFPLAPDSTGTLAIPRYPHPIEKSAEQTLRDLLAALVLSNLSNSEFHEHRGLLNALKSFNLLRMVCTTVTIRHLAKARGRIRDPGSDPPTGKPREGRIGFTAFLRKNVRSNTHQKMSTASESIEQAYALDHCLSPDMVTIMRAGIVEAQVLLEPGALRRVREGDSTILAFANDGAFVSALKSGKRACVISYRHVMHDNGVTGLCQQQLDSVSGRVAEFDYVWVDTVYSRASRRRWAPACVTLFGILECLRTSEASRQMHRTWIKAEAILARAKQQFWSGRSLDYVYATMYQDVQLNAALQIVNGALENTECCFEEDKERLLLWAAEAYTCPMIELTGALSLQEGHLETMAADNHFFWSVLRSPLKPETMRQESETLICPEQAIVKSIQVRALKCDGFEFVLRLLMRLEDRGHCFYDSESQRVFVMFGDVGELGSRLFVYEGVSVLRKGLWMQVQGARTMKEWSLVEADIALLDTCMAMNSGNRFRVAHLECNENAQILDDVIEASSYRYVCRSADVSYLIAACPIPLDNCQQITRQLLKLIAKGMEYRKLSTVYFKFSDCVVVSK